jgi:hypothetical protein
MFLTRDEIRELSGYKRRTDQARWLRENGYPFELDKDGNPKVPRAAVEARFQVRHGGPKLRLA